MHNNKLSHSKINAKAFGFLFFALMIATASSIGATPIKCKAQDKPGINIQSLHCENQQNPMGIDALHPRLGWLLRLEEGARGQYQTAYRIQVASSIKLLNADQPDLWDSGIIDSIQSNNISYQGKGLSSEKRYYWRVKIWDKHHKASAWSSASFWEMGLLKESD